MSHDQPHPERVGVGREALWNGQSELLSDRAADVLAADDAYLAAHPEHVAPEVRAAILAQAAAEIREACTDSYSLDTLLELLGKVVERWERRAAGVVPDRHEQAAQASPARDDDTRRTTDNSEGPA